MSHPRIATLDDIHAIEKTPFNERQPARSTYELLRNVAGQHPNALAITFLPTGRVTDTPIQITYRELFRRVTQTANAFHSLGVRLDAPVTYFLPNFPETHYTIWGGQAAGVVNAVNYFLGAEQMAEIVRSAGSRVLVTLGPTPGFDLWEKAQAVRALVPEIEQVVVLRHGGVLPLGALDFYDLINAQSDDHLISGRMIAPDDVAAFFHTGGTTGLPKLVRHTHAMEVFESWLLGEYSRMEPGKGTLVGLPLFHVNAIIVSGLGPFSTASHTIIAGPLGFRNPETVGDFWKLIERFKVARFSGVPTLYAALLQVPLNGADVSSLEFGGCGAAPMPVALFQAFEERTGIKIIEGYGMTEGTCLSSANPHDGERRIGSIGFRAPYTEMKVAVLDPDGKQVRDCVVGEIGVVLLKGPHVTPGYFHERHNEKAWAGNGWFNTGDLGRVDAQGYFWLTGRAKDLIIRGGHNIDPAIVEEALHRHPAVALAAAVGKPDARAGEVPVAYVTLRPGAAATADELREFARAEVAERPAAPADVFILDRMPMTAVGKIFKPPLREDIVERVYREALATLRTPGLDVSVAVKPHSLHGTLATVTMSGARPDRREALAATVAEVLGPYAIRHEVVWA